MSVQALKNLDLDRVLNMEEAVVLSAEARAFRTEYDELGLEPPEWLERSTEVLREEIARRTRASDMDYLKRLQSELEGYKTVTEKRGEALRKLADLQKKLGLASSAKSGK